MTRTTLLLLASLIGAGVAGGACGGGGGGGDLGDGTHPAGEFLITVDRSTATPRIAVAHEDDPGRVLWETAPDRPPVEAAVAETEIAEQRGSFTVESRDVARCSAGQGARVQRVGADGIAVSGALVGEDACAGSFTLTFRPGETRELGFELTADAPAIDRLVLRGASAGDERFFGFGEQFTYLDLKGQRVPILVQEGGIGRGRQPLTGLLNLVSPGSGGNALSTYMAVPYYVTSRSRSLFLESSELAWFDLREPDAVTIELAAATMRGRILAGRTPLEVIELYTRYAGRMRPLPAWTDQGAVVGMQGGTAEVRRRLAELDARGTPIAAFWLQDWVGQRTTIIGKQLWWNWELDRDRYPGWDELVAELGARGIRVLTYVNPFLVDATPKGNVRRNLFAEALEAGYLVANADGEPLLIPNTSFSAGLIDLTNPAARDWMKGVLRDQLLGVGASGWMADFGEALPFDARLASGESPLSFHNRYPEEWARLNREAVREAGLEDEVVFFSRSGFTRSPGESPLFWLGDQNVTFDADDGLVSSITGLLSGGISGVSLNHSDIGGYTGVGLLGVQRSKELFERWTELNAFTAFFRTHEGNQPDAGVQFYTDEETLAHFDRFARVYRALAPYRRTLMQEAAERGWPVVRHPWLVYPDDPTAAGLTRQLMLGDQLMVAPVTADGQREVTLYLPAGEWVHLWTGDTYGEARRGSRVTVPAAIGDIPVFYPAGSVVGADLVERLRAEGVLPSS